jgi:hypothetical protein
MIEIIIADLLNKFKLLFQNIPAIFDENTISASLDCFIAV